MNFAESALRLCGQCALLFGWRPDEFWTATPAELACILRAQMPDDASPPDHDTITNLMKVFPDG
jgi:Phage tail assembly chaperone protein, TAC